ncbi:MAG TPA: HNH endonuclease signature motif containing protein [Vicinamibacterales bacterium]|nr:HNH endonuclease signature motif containing protein [Vicinamibacterales bacterium]
MELEQFFKDFQDHLAPRLDTYEQAVYLYLFRHTLFIGREEAVIGFKSARRRMACGIGEKGKPMSENTAYEKLRSLEEKGCIKILDSTREGRKIRLYVPSDIPGVIVPEESVAPPDIEAEDFFNVEENRDRILMREGHRCFYCLRRLNGKNYVIEHVVSRPVGNNTYRNVVAACRQCNNKKGSADVEDWLRTLYRDGFLGEAEFRERVSHLERLRAGELKPPQMAG